MKDKGERNNNNGVKIDFYGGLKRTLKKMERMGKRGQERRRQLIKKEERRGKKRGYNSGWYDTETRNTAGKEKGKGERGMCIKMQNFQPGRLKTLKEKKSKDAM